jgi:hypothetical protein
MVGKHARNPQILLIWFLNVFRIFENYLRVCLAKAQKIRK